MSTPGFPQTVSLSFLNHGLSATFRIRASPSLPPKKDYQQNSEVKFYLLGLAFIFWHFQQDDSRSLINHKAHRCVEAIPSVPERQSLTRATIEECNIWENGRLCLQKFKTHDQTISIQFLSTTPKKRWACQLKSQK